MEPGESTVSTPRTRRTRVAEGVYKDRWGLAATVKVHGVQREIRFPPDTSLKTIRAKRAELRADLRSQQALADLSRTLRPFDLEVSHLVDVPRQASRVLTRMPVVVARGDRDSAALGREVRAKNQQASHRAASRRRQRAHERDAHLTRRAEAYRGRRPDASLRAMATHLAPDDGRSPHTIRQKLAALGFTETPSR